MLTTLVFVYAIPQKQPTGELLILPVSLSSDGMIYTTKVGIGKQSFNLQIDTGSANLWVYGMDCMFPKCPNKYDPSTNPKTFIKGGQPLKIGYGSGTFSGTINTEVITIGGKSIDKVIADSMVMHDLNCKEENDKHREGVTRRSLAKNWSRLSKMFKTQPYNEIRDYFGEQIALYFAFMGFYMKWLLFPVIFGIVSVLVGLADSTPGPDVFDNSFTMVYAVFTGLWSTTFLEFWKRRQNFLAYEWKTWECEEVEVPRPEWIATTVSFNTMTWRLEKSYPGIF